MELPRCNVSNVQAGAWSASAVESGDGVRAFAWTLAGAPVYNESLDPFLGHRAPYVSRPTCRSTVLSGHSSRLTVLHSDSFLLSPHKHN